MANLMKEYNKKGIFVKYWAMNHLTLCADQPTSFKHVSLILQLEAIQETFLERNILRSLSPTRSILS